MNSEAERLPRKEVEGESATLFCGDSSEYLKPKEKVTLAADSGFRE